MFQLDFFQGDSNFSGGMAPGPPTSRKVKSTLLVLDLLHCSAGSPCYAPYGLPTLQKG